MEENRIPVVPLSFVQGMNFEVPHDNFQPSSSLRLFNFQNIPNKTGAVKSQHFVAYF
jgi:hypothetical protein